MIWETHPFQPERPDDASNNPYLAYLQAIDAWGQMLGLPGEEGDSHSEEGGAPSHDDVPPDHEALTVTATPPDEPTSGGTPRNLSIEFTCMSERLPDDWSIACEYDQGVVLEGPPTADAPISPMSETPMATRVQYGYHLDDIVAPRAEVEIMGLAYRFQQTSLMILRPASNSPSVITHWRPDGSDPDPYPCGHWMSRPTGLAWQWTPRTPQPVFRFQRTRRWTLADFGYGRQQSPRLWPDMTWARGAPSLKFESLLQLGGQRCDPDEDDRIGPWTWWEHVHNGTHRTLMLEWLMRAQPHPPSA